MFHATELDVTEKYSELQDIINGCLANNRLSQRQLYELFAPKMFIVCRRYANTEAEAEDMLMEGFMNIFKGLDSFRGESRFETWIHSVMVNTAISHYRSVRRFRNELLTSDMMEDTAFIENETITTALDAKQILALLEQMPETMRMVFNLKAVEGFSFTEISEMLDKKENAIRICFMRARNWLKERLGG